MRCLRILAFLTIAGLAAAAIIMALWVSNPGVTDMDVMAFMKTDRWVKWQPDKISITRAELYPAIQDWKREIEARTAHKLLFGGLVALASLLILAVTSFARRIERKP